MKIEIDEQVFEFLQKNGIPFVDTPNSVLRRLLLEKRNSGARANRELSEDHILLGMGKGQMRSQEFVELVLKKEFGEGFRTVNRYRFMFESSNRLVYFQNFNAAGERVWYRISEKPLKRLREANKEQIKRSGWSRNYLEVNIDARTSRWNELNWLISGYRKEYAI